jgi:Regulator of chromosome condensation (RCC1) repeat
MRRALWVLLVSVTMALPLWAFPGPAAAGVPQAPATPSSALRFTGWGANDVGQLTAPASLVSPVQIAAGNSHVVALESDGTVKAWGYNSSGEATVPNGLDHVVAIAAGTWSSVALKSDGTVVGWGDVDQSWLSGLSDVKAIAVSLMSTCVVFSDGTAASPYLVGSPPAAVTDFVSVAAGDLSCLGLRANGTVVGWGDDYDGETSIPVGLKGVRAIADGDSFGIAVLDTGRVVSWGAHTDLFAGVTNAVSVSAGSGRAAVVLDDGSVLDVDTVHTGGPPSESVTGARAVAVGRQFTVALVGDPISPPATAYVPVTPTRILDTRSGLGYSSRLSSRQEIPLPMLGQGGLPSSGVSAVVLNLTATEPTGAGFVTAFPSGGLIPTASNLNFVPGQTVPNLAVVKVGADGSIGLLNGSPGTVQLVADVAGYFPSLPNSTSGAFTSLTPERLLDTRTGDGQKIGPTSSIDLTVTGKGGIPASNVSAVVLNVTVTEGTGSGFITAYPTGSAAPLASNLNFVAGQTVPNLVMVKVGANGQVSFKNGSAGTSHLVVDVAGYFTSGSSGAHGEFVSLAPQRIFDTRDRTPLGKLYSHEAYQYLPLGHAGVSATCVSAIVVNVTVTEPESNGFITVYPLEASLPVVSNLNFVTEQTVPNLVIVKPGLYDAVEFYNSGPGRTHLLADIAGYFTC